MRDCGCWKSHVAQLAEGIVGRPLSASEALRAVHGGMPITTTPTEWLELRPVLVAQLVIWDALHHPSAERLGMEIKRLDEKFGNGTV